jgi:hypothetical protein
MEDRFRVQEAPTTTHGLGLSIPYTKMFALCMSKAKMNQNSTLQACSSLNEDFVGPSF